MKLLLLCLGLTLVWAHEEGHGEVVTSNFDLSKISGEWYSVLLASDEMEKIDENGGLRIFVSNIEASGNSSMSLKYQKKKDGQCTEFSIVAHETAQRGVYGVFYDGYNRFHIIEAVYAEYVVLYTANFDKEKKSEVLELYAREPDVSEEMKTRFQEVCQEYGIPKENILDLTEVDRCLQTRGSD